MGELRRMLLYARAQWGRLGIAIAGALVEMALALVVPWFTRTVIDHITGVQDAEAVLHLLNVVAALLLAFGVIRAVSIFAQVYQSETASLLFAYRLRNDLYDKLQRLSPGYHDRARTGDLMSRLTNDVEQLRQAIGFGLAMLVGSLVWICGILVFLLYLDARFTLICLVFTPCLLYTAMKYARVIHPVFRSIHDQVAQLTAVVQENVTGVRVIRAFAREEEEIKRFAAENEAVYEKNLQAARLSAFYHPLMDFIAHAGTLFVLWYGGREVILGRITIGSLIAFNGYLGMLIWPIRMTGWLLGMMQRASAAADRIMEILRARSPVSQPGNPVVLQAVRGHVRFENVSFSYGDQDVLTDISIDAPPGKTVAIVGGTGSGKSTLVSLIPRFYDATKGQVLVDGYDVRTLDLHSLRRNIGLVMQETFLFSTTVRENIAFGRPEATQQEIEEAAKAAAAHEFIINLPQGYDTVVGERGVGLSGGQKQRIAIARALLLDPRILILDDSTSSVDMETEYKIQLALQRLMEGRTTFIIAHRLSSVKRADEIIVLDKGRIVERGTHEELLAAGAFYQKIFGKQWRLAMTKGGAA